MELHIGCSGWFYWGWRGKFYPESCPTNRWFKHYTRHFKTVELNAPFYSWPKRSSVRSWIKQAPKSFLYSIKINRMITHDLRLAGAKMLTEQFYLDTAEPLGKQCGCILFQFPPSFRFTRGRLKLIVSRLDPRYRSVVEFRHKSWWNAEVYRALRKRGIIFCSVSAPRLPDQLIRTADDIYIRLHGATQWYRHDYSNEELKEWAAKIAASGAKRAWIYFDNDRDANSVRNAKTLTRLLKRPARPVAGRPPARARRNNSQKSHSPPRRRAA